MRIERYERFHVRIPFRTAFEHHTHARKHSDAILIALHGGGQIGWGEIQPRKYVTGETVEDVLGERAEAMARYFVGRDIEDFDDATHLVLDTVDTHKRALATFGGFEMALLDLIGRHRNKSAGTPLGEATIQSLPAGVIIGFEIETTDLPKHCALLRFKRRQHIKVKVGRHDDLERLKVIGTKMKVPLRIDANEAWATDQAIRQLDAFAVLDGVTIESIEQPIPAADLDGLARIRAAGHRVMADESLCSFADAVALVEQGAADVFNIRLGKHGGLLNARRITDYAREHGMGLQLGTMVGETSVLTRATEIFATRVPGFQCLDGKGQNLHLSADDIVNNPAAPFTTPFNAPGLGIEIEMGKLREYGMGAP